MTCWVRHTWRLQDAQPFGYADDWGTRGDKTRFLFQCEQCHKVKTKDLWGTWELE